MNECKYTHQLLGAVLRVGDAGLEDDLLDIVVSGPAVPVPPVASPGPAPGSEVGSDSHSLDSGEFESEEAGGGAGGDGEGHGLEEQSLGHEDDAGENNKNGLHLGAFS